MTAARFLVAGEALFDVFVGDEDAGATQMEARVGGSPFNVAIGLARLGQATAFWGGISTDVLGERLTRILEKEGVDVSLTRRVPKRTTLSLVALSAQRTPSYAFYGAGSADAALSADDLPVLSASVQAIHIGSFATVIQPVGDAIAALVAREAATRLVSYDPNVRPTIEPDLALWRLTLARFSAQVHLIKISAEEFNLLYPGETPGACAADWLSRGVKLVVFTDGAKSVRAWTAAGEMQVASQAVSVVDTIGAGDSFQAAMLATLQKRQLLAADRLGQIGADDLRAVLGYAAKAAAVTCSRRGADLPRSDEIDS